MWTNIETMNTTNSIFIPSVHRSIDAAQLSAGLADLGNIVRTDFFEMVPQKAHWKRAAVYFAQNVTFVTNDVRCYQVGDKTYKCTLLVNTNPIPFSERNIHQIDREVTTLRELVLYQATRIDELILENKKKDEKIKNWVEKRGRTVHEIPFPQLDTAFYADSRDHFDVELFSEEEDSDANICTPIQRGDSSSFWVLSPDESRDLLEYEEDK